MPFSSIPQALDALRSGRFVVVVDDEGRENEGDLILAAEHAHTQNIAFMIRHTGGVVCLALSQTIADQLALPPMVERNTSKYGTPYTVSIDAAQEEVTTGISASDRAATIRTALNPVARPEDLRRPGHVFPLRAQDGGVLVRAGHTEAAIDLCRLAGLRSGAVLSELMHEDGSMMRLHPEESRSRLSLHSFARAHDIPIVSIADLIAWRRRTEVFVRREAESPLDTDTGAWNILVYRDMLHDLDHVALVKGGISMVKPVLVRVHSECLTGDVFGSHHCDCGRQIGAAMRMIEQEKEGVLLYLRQEGRGVGLANKVRAYALQQSEGLDTVEAHEKLGLPVDLREYGIGAQILKDIGVGKLRLLTNNPKKIVGLGGFGLHIVEQVPLEIPPMSERERTYLRAKKEKLGHILRHV